MSLTIEISYYKSPAHKDRLKYAVDFIVPEGTKIRAAFDGVVINVKQDSDIGGKTKKYDIENCVAYITFILQFSICITARQCHLTNAVIHKYGNYIEIKHKNGEYSTYEHIKQNCSLVRIGDKVKAGQVIGYSGATGWLASLGSHLHFEVHKYFGEGKEDYESLKICWVKNQKNLMESGL